MNLSSNYFVSLILESGSLTIEGRRYSRAKKEFLVDRIFALFKFNSSQKIVLNWCVKLDKSYFKRS